MSDSLAFYTWFHAAALAISLVGGAISFAMYFTRKYDGDRIVPGYEWRRGTGHGTYAGKVTVADLYSRNNKWKSYRKYWEKTGRFFCLCGAAFFFFIALVFPHIPVNAADSGRYAWAADYALTDSGPTPLWEIITQPTFLPKVLVTLLAVITGFRLAYGVARLLRHRWRKKNGKGFESMDRGESACMGLSTADCFVSLAVVAAFIYPIVMAALSLFGEGAESAAKLPDAYYSLLAYWQAGLTAAYLIWAVVQSILRKRIMKQYRR